MDALRLRHSSPGRVRFEFSPIKHNKKLCRLLENKLGNIPGIASVTASHLTGTILIYYNSKKTTAKSLIPVIGNCMCNTPGKLPDANWFPVAVPAVINKKAATPAIKEFEEFPIHIQMAQVAVTGLVLFILAFRRLFNKGALGPKNKLFNLSSTTALVSSLPVIQSGISGLVKEKRLNNDLLIGAATLVALAMGEGLTALTVVWLVNLSELLKSITLDRSRKAIGELLKNKNEQAWLLVDGTQMSVPVESLKPGDVVVVHDGGKIPVDGKVITGDAAVNQSPITGESVPVYKHPGDLVYAGTVVEQGTIHIRTEKSGNDTALSRIIHLVETAANKRAPIQNIAESYSYKIVPMSFLLASMVFLFTRDIHRTMTILIVACPCAAGLATPTAISAAMGNAASRGILIKGGCYLEAAGRIDTVLFDKTGTLTEGRPEVCSYKSVDNGLTPEQVLFLAAVGEKHTNHPLALAVLNKARECNMHIPNYQSKELIVGKGLKVTVDNEEFLIGNKRLMTEEKINCKKVLSSVVEMASRGETVIFIARRKKVIGLIGVKDKLRKQSKNAIVNLREAGINEIGIISGDTAACAKAVGSELEISDIWSNMLPEDKVKMVYDKQKLGRIVAMVGEGINDSPALAAADIGIAMGVKGTDVAVESADVVLAGDDPVKVAQLVKLARRTMRVIHQNFAFAIGANALGITLGTLKIISPLTAALLHNASTLAVVVNSASLIKYDKEYGGRRCR